MDAATLAWDARLAFERLDLRATRLMARYGATLLRVALGVVFLWFGLLKVIGRSPVEALVAGTIPWAPASVVIPALGILEVALGVGLVLGLALRAVLAIFWAQLAGTFLVLVLQPAVAFQDGNPLLLTVEGEFVVKNLVLIAAGLVVGGTVRERGRSRRRAQRA
ncbi:MAG TPA: hypothetical protein VM889_04665 [Candidatus Thermoplasmatota archaeon]|nr:hypothetical protein [Candidatus Thermoplasmatota archaeon]